MTAITGVESPGRASRCAGLARINGREVPVHWTESAERALRARGEPLILELELYFSCLVKKAVHVRASAGAHRLAWVDERLALYFRPVTSTACSWDTVERLGRQPETEIDTAVAARLAPRSVSLDYREGRWIGAFSL
ncbi:MAG: hypothetical protein JSW68_06345 [Burkholderiales bacterium]|nr:MAG: hypothetical protein JSW68_06345 [Burkholderiales bacterium]